VSPFRTKGRNAVAISGCGGVFLSKYGDLFATGVGAEVSKSGRTGDRDLDRNGDVTLYFLGRLPWPLRDDAIRR
jgi:hypothetical protein